MESEDADGLSIAELARRANVTVRTVRYYLAEGLLPSSRAAGPRSSYSQGHLHRLLAIRRLKDAYLPLAEIKRRLDEMSDDDVRALVDADAAPPPDSAAAYIAALQGAQGDVVARHRQIGFMPPTAPSQMMLRGAREEGPRLSAMATPPPPAPIPRPSEPLWRRRELAPGVELHYRVGDPRRDQLIERVAREAAARLARLEE